MAGACAKKEESINELNRHISVSFDSERLENTKPGKVVLIHSDLPVVRVVERGIRKETKVTASVLEKRAKHTSG